MTFSVRKRSNSGGGRYCKNFFAVLTQGMLAFHSLFMLLHLVLWKGLAKIKKLNNDLQMKRKTFDEADGKFHEDIDVSFSSWELHSIFFSFCSVEAHLMVSGILMRITKLMFLIKILTLLNKIFLTATADICK